MKNKLRILYVGCVQMSDFLLDATLSIREAEVVGVITKEASSYNSDFCNLKARAEELAIPVWTRKVADATVWARELKPDILYCFGWSELLSQDFFAIPRMGGIGFHPAALPANRGRHPLIWTLALGLMETASTFFYMDEGADSGDILDQRKIGISKKDNAHTLYEKVKRTAASQVRSFTPKLLLGNAPRRKQNAVLASSWRKRSALDGRIDWRMSARSIYNLVRALSKPYPGATFMYAGVERPLWAAEICKTSDVFAEPGKVLQSGPKGVVVRCGEQAIRVPIDAFENPPRRGEYL